MAQAGLNDEKNGSRKSRWTVPLKVPVPGNSDLGSFRVSKNAASVFALCPIAGTPCRCDDVNDLPESCLRS